MIRVFLAVELSSDIRQKLFSLQQQLKAMLPPMNWIRPESIHLTLKFLGSIDTSQIPYILSVIEPIGKRQGDFSIEIQGLGVFPYVTRPRIFWVGISGKSPNLQELVLEIEAALEPLGFPPEEKAYHPHLTLARIKGENFRVGEALLENHILKSDQKLGTLRVHRFILFQSVLDSTGATYVPLGSVALSGEC